MELSIGRIYEESKKSVEKKLKKKNERAAIKREIEFERDWNLVNPMHINSYGIQRKDY